MGQQNQRLGHKQEFVCYDMNKMEQVKFDEGGKAFLGRDEGGKDSSVHLKKQQAKTGLNLFGLKVGTIPILCDYFEKGKFAEVEKNFAPHMKSDVEKLKNVELKVQEALEGLLPKESLEDMKEKDVGIVDKANLIKEKVDDARELVVLLSTQLSVFKESFAPSDLKKKPHDSTVFQESIDEAVKKFQEQTKSLNELQKCETDYLQQSWYVTHVVEHLNVFTKVTNSSLSSLKELKDNLSEIKMWNPLLALKNPEDLSMQVKTWSKPPAYVRNVNEVLGKFLTKMIKAVKESEEQKKAIQDYKIEYAKHEQYVAHVIKSLTVAKSSLSARSLKKLEHDLSEIKLWKKETDSSEKWSHPSNFVKLANEQLRDFVTKMIKQKKELEDLRKHFGKENVGNAQ